MRLSWSMNFSFVSDHVFIRAFGFSLTPSGRCSSGSTSCATAAAASAAGAVTSFSFPFDWATGVSTGGDVVTWSVRRCGVVDTQRARSQRERGAGLKLAWTLERREGRDRMVIEGESIVLSLGKGCWRGSAALGHYQEVRMIDRTDVAWLGQGVGESDVLQT